MRKALLVVLLLVVGLIASPVAFAQDDPLGDLNFCILGAGPGCEDETEDGNGTHVADAGALQNDQIEAQQSGDVPVPDVIIDVRMNLSGVTMDSDRVNEELFPNNGIRVDWDQCDKIADLSIYPSIAFGEDLRVLYGQTGTDEDECGENIGQNNWTFDSARLEELEETLGEDFVMIAGGVNVSFNQDTDGYDRLNQSQVIIAAQPDPEDGTVRLSIRNGFVLFVQGVGAGQEYCERLRQGFVANDGPWYDRFSLIPPFNTEVETIEDFLENACKVPTAAG